MDHTRIDLAVGGDAAGCGAALAAAAEAAGELEARLDATADAVAATRASVVQHAAAATAAAHADFAAAHAAVDERERKVVADIAALADLKDAALGGQAREVAHLRRAAAHARAFARTAAGCGSAAHMARVWRRAKTRVAALGARLWCDVPVTGDAVRALVGRGMRGAEVG